MSQAVCLIINRGENYKMTTYDFKPPKVLGFELS